MKKSTIYDFIICVIYIDLYSLGSITKLESLINLGIIN
jgi:hypothetical protein